MGLQACTGFLATLFLAMSFCAGAPRKHRPTLLLVSFDGFRWDYLTRTNTPNFDRITSSGVKAKWTVDQFVSVTFPNHYTIVTGLYEESHGIVANEFYDPVFDEVFNIDNDTTGDGKFYGGEPIWVTNQLQGGRSGSYAWWAANAEIKGVRPNIWEPYRDDGPDYEKWKNHTDTVVRWLTDPDIVVDLALLYFDEPDSTGHTFGPDSPEIVKMIQQCDKITGYLLDRLKEHGLLGKLNIIMTSDHGMASMVNRKILVLEDYVDESQMKHLLNYKVGAAFWPNDEGMTDEIYQNLSRMDKHISVWKRNEIPSEYHYSHNRRVPPILLSSDQGWITVSKSKNESTNLGDHGFNNSLPDMHPFFIATGPAFKKGYVSEPFENIHIYELMCYILGLEPAPNNGSLDAVKHLLSSEQNAEEFSYLAAKWMALAVAFMLIVAFLVYTSRRSPGTPIKVAVRDQHSGRWDSEADLDRDDREHLLSSE